MFKGVKLNENHAGGRRTAEGRNFKDWMGRSNTVRRVYTLRHGDVVGILTTGKKSFGFRTPMVSRSIRVILRITREEGR